MIMSTNLSPITASSMGALMASMMESNPLLAKAPRANSKVCLEASTAYTFLAPALAAKIDKQPKPAN